jgi:hypothetical protein
MAASSKPFFVLTHLVERIKTMEAVLMGVHVQSVDGQVVGGQLERLEHLAKREVDAVAMNDHLLRKSNSSVSAGPASDREEKGELRKQEGLTSGQRFILLLMKRRRCFWFIAAEWCTWVST